jgi:plastocyanin
MLTLSQGDYNTDDKWTGQTKVTVKDGKAQSEGFSNSGEKLTGDYDLSVSMSIPKTQSDAVRAVIGDKGEYMTGPLVTAASIGDSNVVSALFSVSMGDTITIAAEDDYTHTIFATEEEEDTSTESTETTDSGSDAAANKEFIDKYSTDIVVAASLALDQFIDKKSYKMSLAPQNWTLAKFDETPTTVIGTTDITYKDVKTTYIYVGTLNMDSSGKVTSATPHYIAIGSLVLGDDHYCDDVFEKLGMNTGN